MAGHSTGRYDVTLLSSGHNVADARLHRLVGALRRNGLAVEVIAQGVVKDAPQGSTFRKAIGGKGLAMRVARAVCLPWLARGKVLITIDPDLIAMSMVVARSRHRQVVVDVHEDYLSLLRDRTWAKGAIGIAARAVALAATALAKEADLTVVADAHVPPLTARNRLVVRNLPDLQIPSTDEIDAQPRAVYVGDVRQSRGLGTMLRAIEITESAGLPWRLDVVGPVASADQEFVDHWLLESPARHLVTFHGRLAPVASWEIALGAWVGLSLLDNTPAFNAAVPTKLYEYAAAHLAVLTTPIPRCVELVSEHQVGKVVFDAAQAGAELIAWANDLASLREVRAAAALWAETLDTRAEYDPFAAQVASLSGQKGRLDK